MNCNKNRKSHIKTEKSFECLRFYKYLSIKNKRKFIFRELSLLFFPLMLLVVYCFCFRSQSIPSIDLYFLASVISASILFILAPVFIFKFIKEFIILSITPELSKNIHSYFSFNKNRHYKLFIKWTLVFSSIVCLIVIGALLIRPDIITLGVSHGYHDWLYWILLFFISYFLCFCSTGTSAIFLTIKVVWELCKNNIINYNPNKYEDYISVKYIIRFVNKVIAYFCSGMLFLPFAWYFLLYQKATVYHTWSIILLCLYGIFLFMSLAIPRTILSFYQRDRVKKYIRRCKEVYADIQTSLQQNLIIYSKHSRISDELRLYNTYCYIKEIEKMPRSIKALDIGSIITYISIIATIISIVEGIIVSRQ